MFLNINSQPYHSDLWDSAYEALCNQAFDTVRAWLRSHLVNFFGSVPGVEDIVGFLLGGKWHMTVWEGCQSPPLHIFRSLVGEERTSLLSSYIFRVFPEIEYADLCHGIIQRYMALPFECVYFL